jgi:ribosome assembly protein YihI (activator of Der GTPase)
MKDEQKANEIDIIIKALKMEAERKPDERIYLDFKSYTYKEFINMLDNYEKLNNDEKQFVDKFLEESVRLFKENKAFREKILSMV